MFAPMKATITPDEAAELRRLYDELYEATAAAADALRTKPPAHELDGSALARFREADQRTGEIVGRIKKITGDT